MTGPTDPDWQKAKQKGERLQEQAVKDARHLVQAAPRCPDHPGAVLARTEGTDLVVRCWERTCRRELARHPLTFPTRVSPPGY